MKRFNRPDPNAEVKELIQAIYNEHDGRYGYRHIRDELMNRGHKVNHKKSVSPYERIRVKMSGSYEKISLLQRDSWENCAKYFKSQLPS